MNGVHMLALLLITVLMGIGVFLLMPGDASNNGCLAPVNDDVDDAPQESGSEIPAQSEDAPAPVETATEPDEGSLPVDRDVLPSLNDEEVDHQVVDQVVETAQDVLEDAVDVDL